MFIQLRVKKGTRLKDDIETAVELDILDNLTTSKPLIC